MPVEPDTPWGATAGPSSRHIRLPMAATVAGPLALGLGSHPKGLAKMNRRGRELDVLSCAGMAAGASAVLGCGA